MRSELRCLAAGQPSRPISVEAPLWSQVVGSAYREDQQRSVSPLRSLSLSFSLSPLHLLPLFLSFLFSALSPFGITPSPYVFFPQKSPYFHLYLIIVSLPFSHLPPTLSLPNSLKMCFFPYNSTLI